MVLFEKIILIALIVFLLTDRVVAQVDTCTKPGSALASFLKVSESAKYLTKIERIGYVCGASLVFSLFDYIGYNLVRVDNKAPLWYRILQSTIGSSLTYFLYKECGLNSAVSFSLIWWTWGDDLGYYGWGNIFKPGYGFRQEPVTWAGWTPIGLGRKKGSIIDNATLTIQAMVGFSISIAIL